MDLLLTVGALIATVYAIVPRDRQLEINLRFGTLDWMLVWSCVLAVTYLQFNEYFSVHGWVINKSWPRGITPQNSTYVVMATFVLLIWLHIRFTKLSRSRIRKFEDLAEQLYWSEKYGELLALLNRHLGQMIKIWRSDFALARFQRSLRNLHQPDVAEVIKALTALDDPKAGNRTPVARGTIRPSRLRWLAPVAPALVRMLPDYNASARAASDTFRAVVLSPRFVSALSRTRPYFGIDIIRDLARCQERHDFIDLYLTELIRDTQSILYSEIFHNERHFTGDHRAVSESNRLLCFFLRDAKVAEDDSIWKPIGDFTLDYLVELGRDPDADPYNRSLVDSSFAKKEVWHSPVFICIHFFDIMVREALLQNITWHMWLYYLPDFVRCMVANFRLNDPLSNPDDEQSNRYGFLVYEAFDVMRHWVERAKELPSDQNNVILQWPSARLENGNILKSSLTALSQSLRWVLECDEIPNALKDSLSNMVFALFFELRESTQHEGYAKVLATLLSNGGTVRAPNRKYKQALIHAFSREENEFPYHHDDPHIAELRTAVFTT